MVALSDERAKRRETELLPEDEAALSLLRPYVAAWFVEKYGSMTEPQRRAIPLIKSGKSVLISSPTGTGKTLAAFLGVLDELFAMAERGELRDLVYVVYVSPLRALNNDMRRNLVEPLEEIKRVAAEEWGLELPEIRVAVRTGDTPPSERQKMNRRPPHILITTPESLSLVLVAPRFRENLRETRWVIVDEIHELAGSKRGSHLSLLLERLEALVGRELQRIGLSATIAPLEEIARFLGGYRDDGSPRPVEIVDARFYKAIDVRVLVPEVDLVYARAEEFNEAIYGLIAELVKRHRTTLIFTNTRSSTERVVFKLKKMFERNGVVEIDDIEAHHGSLSRDLRLDVERRLKEGKLKVVVSSTSLELGIDIGYIDLVVLLSSPKSVSRLLQRVGRAGHRLSEVSRGRLIVVDRDDLLECAALADAARRRLIDRTRIPRNPLDVLAQNLVAMSLERKWRVDEAYKLVRRSYSFHSLSFEDFERILRFLGGLDGELEEHRVFSKLWYDPLEGSFGRKRGVRAIYYLNQGIIPDEAKVRVFVKSRRKYVGDLEEEFVELLSPGDVFVLGGRTYRFLSSEGGKVYVEEAEKARPTVPSWFSEMLPLSFDSALLVGRLRREIAERIESGASLEEIARELAGRLELSEHAAREMARYVREQYEFTGGVVASDKLIHVELYDEGRSRNVVFHALFGRRVNDALSRALALIASEELSTPVRVTISDYAFMLTIGGRPSIEGKELLLELKSRGLRRVLERAVMSTELMRRKFRHCAQRSFMILRSYRGRERSPHRLQLSAQSILEALRETDHPIVKEALREVIEDHMDVDNASLVLDWIERGEIDVVQTEPSDVPSPFAHHIVTMGYEDVVLMEDKRRMLAELHRRVLQMMLLRAEERGPRGAHD
ncbi:MAG: ATP-dependent helicase [Fervidicoccaceae archaeon]